MIFRILGPLTVEAAGSLGGPKQRALLALLLIRAGEAIPAGALVDEVWGEEPPATAAHAVQVYVSQLRKALSATSAVIESEAGSYRLRVGHEQIDARVFARLADDGRRAFEGGEPAEAGATFDRALALWRGPALADFRYEPFAQREIARLEELRLVVAEQRAEALLTLDRHAELVPELQQLVAAEPLRERLRAHLMLALYRSGRQADALAVYREGAHTFREELGLEPGSALRELEAAMLAQDPRLLDTRPRVLLPAPATPLIGRGDEAAEIESLLRSDARIVTLTGAGGIGKTRMAIEAASRVAGTFPGGVFFVGLGSVAGSDLVMPTIAEALDVAHVDADPLAAVAAAIADRRTLLVVDNFEHVVDAAPALGRLLSSCVGVKLLVTSRRAPRMYGEHEYEVPPLVETDAVALFRARAAAHQRGHEDTGETEVIAEICRRLDGLPLAIELAAARSGLLTAGEMLSGLPSRLELAASGPRDAPSRQQTLRATIEWSNDLLDEKVAAVFRRLGVFAGGWEADAALAVAAAGRDELAQLVEHSLISRERPSGRFRMLTTIREFAWERLEQGGGADDVQRRHAEHFLRLAEHGDSMLRASAGQAEALDGLEREHDNLRAALAWSQANDPELQLRLAGALGSFWAVRGHLHQARLQLESALAGVDEEAVDPLALARGLTSAGAVLRSQTDHAAALPLLERGAELYREIGDNSGLVRALANLGFVRLALGERDQAATGYEEALLAARASGNDRDRCLVLNCLADLELRVGRFRRVDELAAESLAIARDLEDAEAVAVTLMNRAHSAFGSGRSEEALAAGVESLEAWIAIGDEASAAWSLDVIAGVVAEHAPDVAARLAGAADAARRRAGVGLDEFELEVHLYAQREAAARLGPEALAHAGEEGAAMAFDAAVAEALSSAARASRA